MLGDSAVYHSVQYSNALFVPGAIHQFHSLCFFSDLLDLCGRATNALVVPDRNPSILFSVFFLRSAGLVWPCDNDKDETATRNDRRVRLLSRECRRYLRRTEHTLTCSPAPSHCFGMRDFGHACSDTIYQLRKLSSHVYVPGGFARCWVPKAWLCRTISEMFRVRSCKAYAYAGFTCYHFDF